MYEILVTMTQLSHEDGIINLFEPEQVLFNFFLSV